MSTYTRIVGVAATLAGSLLLPGASRVSAQEPVMKIVLPFEFTVRETTLPRGTYEVSRLASSPDVLLLWSARHQIFVLGQRDTREIKHEVIPSLVFDRYGNEYFLREVRFPEGVEMHVPEPAAEREAVRQRASAGRPEVVVVAAELR